MSPPGWAFSEMVGGKKGGNFLPQDARKFGLRNYREFFPESNIKTYAP